MEGIEQPNHKRIRIFGEKENYKYLEILKVDSIKQSEMKEKNKKRVQQTNERASRNQVLQPKSHHRDKHLGSPPCKILETVLKIDKKVSQTYGPNGKIDYSPKVLYSRYDIDCMYQEKNE